MASNTESGKTLFLVASNKAGLSRQAIHTMDSRGYANLEFNDVEIDSKDILGHEGHGSDLLDKILDCGRAGLSAEMLGTGAQAFDMTLEYLKTREQFGRVIGSFRHSVTEPQICLVKMELSRSCMEAAQVQMNKQKILPRWSPLSKARVRIFCMRCSTN